VVGRPSDTLGVGFGKRLYSSSESPIAT